MLEPSKIGSTRIGCAQVVLPLRRLSDRHQHGLILLPTFLEGNRTISFRSSCLGIGSRNWASLMTQFADITWDVNNLRSIDFLGQIADTRAGRDELSQEMTKLASVADRIVLFKAGLLANMMAIQDLWPFALSPAFLPWHQITNISPFESSYTRNCAIDILRNAPHLRTAQLICKTLKKLEGTAMLIHRNLECFTLHIGKSNAQDLLAFLSNCTFPNLTKLWFAVESNTEGIQHNTQIPTINTMPSLEVRYLTEDMRVSRDHLVSPLYGTPKLQSLFMNVVDGDGHSTDLDHIFSSMTIEGGHCKLLSRLEQCVFCGVPDTPGTKFFLDAGLVSWFINSRCQDVPEGCSRLRDTKLIGCFVFLVNVQAEVEHLNQGKNQVSIVVEGAGNTITVSDALRFHVPFASSQIDHNFTPADA